MGKINILKSGFGYRILIQENYLSDNLKFNVWMFLFEKF